jgi:NitT/TauT family transport system ATP-binding protein
MLTLSNVTLSYDTGAAPVLRDFSLTVLQGQVVALFGPNGCGKSTLLRYLAGVPSAVHAAGGSVKSVESIGYVPQDADSTVMEWLTVAGNIYLPRRLRGGSLRDAASHAAQALAQLNVVLPIGLSGSELSGGQRHMVAIARELGRQPQLLLMDEALSPLDYSNRLAVIHSLRSWVRQNDVSILCVCHDSEEAATIADVVAILTPRPATVFALVDVPQGEETDAGQLAVAITRIRRRFQEAARG